MLGFEGIGVGPLFFWSVCFAAVMAVSISKAGFGGALGSLSIPIMLLVLPPKIALGVMLPLFLVTDVLVVTLMRRMIDRRILLIMCGFALAGQLTGWLFFDHLSERLLVAAIGVVGLTTALNYFRHVVLPGGESGEAVAARVTRRIWRRALCWCGLSGLASFVSLSGGVPAQIFLLPHGLARQAFVGTMSVYFLCINLAKFPFYLELGLFSDDTLRLSAALLPVIALGVYTGRWLNRKMTDRAFYHVSHVLLFALSVKLLYDGLWP